MKLQKISANIRPFAGIIYVNYRFNTVGLSQLIDNVLGARVKTIGFSSSEIIRSEFFLGKY